MTGKFSRVENTVGKVEIACYEPIFPCPTVFSEYLYSQHTRKKQDLLQSERVKVGIKSEHKFHKTAKLCDLIKYILSDLYTKS